MIGKIDYLTDYVRAYADIRLDNVLGNVAALKAFCRPAGIMAVVKANAYGHGAAAVCGCIEPLVDYFGVSDIVEAKALRRDGITKPVLIFGYTSEKYAELLVDLNITQTVYDDGYALRLNQALCGSGKRLKAHIKLDTGMSRLGEIIENDVTSLKRISELCNLDIEGVYTHLAVSEACSNASYADEQIERFSYILGKAEECGIYFKYRHCCASGGIGKNIASFNLVRIGLAMYGLCGDNRYALPLREAMTLRSRVISVKRVKKGTPVGYGCMEILERDTNLVCVAIGYADGFPRELSGKGRVYVRGKALRVVGRVCMDMIILDGGDDDFKIGDEAEIFGFGTPVGIDEFSDWCKTVNYETICRISPRVKRRFIFGEAMTVYD